jgi:hypothetical protein
MFEFNTNFDVNTGELEALYIGSGVHLYKDVTFSFSLIDPMGNVIQNDRELVNNPLINEVIFDIMDTGRNVVFQAYKSGSISRSITLTENENQSIFGTYNPNFGIKATVTNRIGTDPFVSEFYTYGNKPVMSPIYQVYDGSGLEKYDPITFWKFNLKTSLLTGLQVRTESSGDVRVIWGDDEFDLKSGKIFGTGSDVTYFSSGLNFTRSSSTLVTANVSGHTFSSGNVVTITGITYPIDFNGTHVITNATSGQFQYNTTGFGSAIGSGIAGITLTPGAYFYSGIIEPEYNKIILYSNIQNNPNYINIEKYDIYVSQSSLDEIVLFESDRIKPSENSNFLISHFKQNFIDLNKINIQPIGLLYDVPYYFKIVPFSSVGSGEPISFGPKIFKSPPNFIETETGISTINQINLVHGDTSMNIDFITGSINTSGLFIIDTIQRGIYNTISYTVQITDSNKTVSSSEIKLVDTYLSSIGSGISISEYAISNNSNIFYSVESDSSYAYLKVSGVIPNAIYKLYKTSI